MESELRHYRLKNGQFVMIRHYPKSWLIALKEFLGGLAVALFILLLLWLR